MSVEVRITHGTIVASVAMSSVVRSSCSRFFLPDGGVAFFAPLTGCDALLTVAGDDIMHSAIYNTHDTSYCTQHHNCILACLVHPHYARSQLCSDKYDTEKVRKFSAVCFVGVSSL